jgi:hypothetical protein
VRGEGGVVDEGGEGGVVDGGDLLDLVRGAEPVEEVQERHPRPKGRGVGDGREIDGSFGDPEASIANPVPRAAMTSEWSPKIDRAWVATLRAATCMHSDVSSPAILNRFGVMSSSPCDDVNVVARAPACNAPRNAPAAPPSDCISTTSGTMPHRFARPVTDHSSACSPIGEAGVIG